MNRFLALLAYAEAGLTAGSDPDGVATQQALLLAARAGTAQPASVKPDWDLYTVAVTGAIQLLRAGIGAPVVLVDGLPQPEPDGPVLRPAVLALVRKLADLFATAARAETGSPWRRMVWAQVAHRLDDAAAELT